jgi:hypothetical protein
MRNAAGLFHHFQPACNIAQGISNSFPVFLGDQLSDLLVVLANLALELKHVTLTHQKGDLRPTREGI